MVGNLCATSTAWRWVRRGSRWGARCGTDICVHGRHRRAGLNEEEIPVIQIRVEEDHEGHISLRKIRGGQGYEMIAPLMSNMWGHGSAASAQSIVHAGLFGGYSRPPIRCASERCRHLRNHFEKSDPAKWEFSIVDIMNKQPFAGRHYQYPHMGLQFELCNRGELYMIMQGSGGRLRRCAGPRPLLVIKDVEEDLISQETRRAYTICLQFTTLVLDRQSHSRRSQCERAARKKRGVPYKDSAGNGSRRNRRRIADVRLLGR